MTLWHCEKTKVIWYYSSGVLVSVGGPSSFLAFFQAICRSKPSSPMLERCVLDTGIVRQSVSVWPLNFLRSCRRSSFLWITVVGVSIPHIGGITGAMISHHFSILFPRFPSDKPGRLTPDASLANVQALDALARDEGIDIQLQVELGMVEECCMAKPTTYRILHDPMHEWCIFHWRFTFLHGACTVNLFASQEELQDW